MYLFHVISTVVEENIVESGCHEARCYVKHAK